MRAVPGQLVKLDERAGIEQAIDPFPRGHLALGVLALDRTLRARVDRLVPALLEIGDLAGGGVDVDRRGWRGRGRAVGGVAVDYGGFGGHAGQG
ncbi:MAG TPA: hypothetical protein VIX35_10020, partial [Vicinamibacterales bacterium]